MHSDDNPSLPVIADPPVPPSEPAPRAANPNRAERVAGGLWNWVVPILFLMSLTVILVYAATLLIPHWRLIDAHAEAERVFLKRQAELKAEAEFAEQRLELLDKRLQLTSYGFRAVARKVLPVVVNVVNYREATEKDLSNLIKKTYVIYDPDDDKKYVQMGVGSGLIYKPGIILTNHHVIRDAQRLRISFPSGRSIGIDPAASASDVKTDLAVIRLPEKMSPALTEESQKSAEFADSDKDVHLADWVLAMGSPLGLRHSVTHGIISAKGRLLSTRENDDDLIELLQTDAAINPGNSGGPLFDQLGRVVGINVMIASDTGRAQGIGFAIPSNTVKRVAEHLLTHGEVPRGFLGITMEEMRRPDAKKLNIEEGAVIVKSVVKMSAADKAGIEPGDVIVAINKASLERLRPIRHLRQLVTDLDPGTQITVDFVRGEERRQVRLTLGKRPANVP